MLYFYALICVLFTVSLGSVTMASKGLTSRQSSRWILSFSGHISKHSPTRTTFYRTDKIQHIYYVRCTSSDVDDAAMSAGVPAGEEPKRVNL